jgi:predicted esterase
VPAGAAAAAALPVYAGRCPTVSAAPTFTSITSSGAERKFLVFRPQTIAVGEKLPVIFFWHWLGGSPEGAGNALDIQLAADARRFIAVVPSPKGDAPFRWPFDASQSQGRVDEEAAFFDDMLACVGAAFPINKDCVSSAGVSAGALWTAQLATLRSQRLSSIASLSGGTGTSGIRPWSTTPHRLPALVLWGGDDDSYPSNIPLMKFDDASNDLTTHLTNDNHLIVECIHNCGHAVPPFDAPPAGGLRFDPLWRFVLDHPFWLGASQSPYTGKPLPAAYPSWCAIGKGKATPRPNSATCE